MDIRVCRECGKEWEDTGMSYECPICGSDDTFVYYDDDELEDDDESDEGEVLD